MSWINAGLGDAALIVRLAWDLYRKCYVDLKDAPEEFQRLVQELGTLRWVLKNVRDDIAIVERRDQQRKKTLERCLGACHKTLLLLDRIVERYSEIGISERKNLWKKLSFSNKKDEIENIRTRIRGHHVTISLCLSSIQTRMLGRIEDRLLPALLKDENFVIVRRPSETPTEHRIDDSEYGDKLVLDKNRTNSLASHSHARANRSSTLNTEAVEASNQTLSSPGDEPLAHRQPSLVTTQSVDMAILEEAPALEHTFNLDDELEEAIKLLGTIREIERLSRPVEVPSEKSVDRARGKIKEKFEEQARQEVLYRKVNPIAWLRIGTWWFLKARCLAQSSEKDAVSSSNGSSITNCSNPCLAVYIHLLKASWILFDVVLNREYEIPLSFADNRRMFDNLSNGLVAEFQRLRNFSPAFTEDDLLEQEELLNIWEPLQTQEQVAELELTDADNTRWITVQKGDAGNSDEQVMFRTFVDAAIGGGSRTVWKKGAPYLLMLCARDGDSEPKLTLCNQSGSLYLTRDFTIDDISTFEAKSNPATDIDFHDQSHNVRLSFEDEDACIGFLSEYDATKFVHIPKNYFAAVNTRESREDTNSVEELIFRSPLEMYKRLHSFSISETKSQKEYKSCDLRVLETRCRQGWQTVRRLVISSSVVETSPWCKSYFLPMDHVQMQFAKEHKRKITIKWSDCLQEDYTHTDGNYIYLHSHVYDESKPNNAFEFVFRTQADALGFRDAILRLPGEEIFRWQNAFSSDTGSVLTIGGSVHETSDADPDPKKYRGISIVRSRLDWIYSEVFYSYRNLDLRYDSATHELCFHSLPYSWYRSTHFEEYYQPTAAKPPAFLRCEKKYKPTGMTFRDQKYAHDFISALSNFQLVFTRKASFVSMRRPSLFRNPRRSNKGRAEVQVWRRGHVVRVTSRWSDMIADKWISLEVDMQTLRYTVGDSQVMVPNASFDRGCELNINEVVAAGRNGTQGTRRYGYLTFGFATSRDQEEFVLAVRAAAAAEREKESRASAATTRSASQLSGVDST